MPTLQTGKILTLEQTLGKGDGKPITIRVVCSICKRAFKEGEKYIGQVTGTHANYAPAWHLGHPVDVPASMLIDTEILDFFHTDCLE